MKSLSTLFVLFLLSFSFTYAQQSAMAASDDSQSQFSIACQLDQGESVVFYLYNGEIKENSVLGNALKDDITLTAALFQDLNLVNYQVSLANNMVKMEVKTGTIEKTALLGYMNGQMEIYSSTLR